MKAFKYKPKSKYTIFDLSSESDFCLAHSDLSKEFINRAFHKNGFIFHHSNLSSEKDIYSEFLHISDQIGKNPISDATRRKRFSLNENENSKISSVDLDYPHVDPHAETSFSPARPAVIAFVCLDIDKEAQSNGLTTIVDGNNFWLGLDSEFRSTLLSSYITYKLQIDLPKIKSKSSVRRPWYLDYSSISNVEIDFHTSKLYFDYLDAFVTTHPISRVISIANHNFINLNTEPQILQRQLISLKFSDMSFEKLEASQLNESLHDYIKTIKWRKGLSIYIDNYRYMHGRLGYNMSNNRRIFIRQLKNFSSI